MLARDAAGNTSPPTAPWMATVTPPSDTTPPSQPTGLVATVTGSSVSLSWSASSDDTAVSGYEVHRSTVSGLAPSEAQVAQWLSERVGPDAPTLA